MGIPAYGHRKFGSLAEQALLVLHYLSSTFAEFCLPKPWINTLCQEAYLIHNIVKNIKYHCRAWPSKQEFIWYILPYIRHVQISLLVLNLQMYTSLIQTITLRKNMHASLMEFFSSINCALIVTWKPNCIFLLLKYHTSNNLMDMSALPVAINRPSGLKRAHLATFYKIKEIQLSIIVQHLSILIIIIIKVGCNNKNIQ